jgi:glycerate 2-kinase
LVLLRNIVANITKKQVEIILKDNRILKRADKFGKDACEIIAEAINAVNPYDCVRECLNLNGDILTISNDSLDLKSINRIFLIGFGKAACPMASAVLDVLGARIYKAMVITKSAPSMNGSYMHDGLQVFTGDHPVPSVKSIESTKHILDMLPTLTHHDLVLVVISGGGSALFTLPAAGITLTDYQSMINLLLKCGAEIKEINTLRKQLDEVKGGRLAIRLQPAIVHSLILSDVVGDPLDMIASGPTVPDLTTIEDALAVIDKYGLINQMPLAIMDQLLKVKNNIQENTARLGQFPPGKVVNHLVGTNFKAALAAKNHAVSLGYNALVITSCMTGLTKNVAKFLLGIIQTELKNENPAKWPACLIFGGETTVEVTGNGKGGRNQDLILRMVKPLNELTGVLVISIATDGEDGPTDAAGAAVDSYVYKEGIKEFGLDIEDFIKNNNSYEYLEKCGALIKTGLTETNVNDLMLILVDPT